MALCVTISSAGTLVQTGETVANCSGYVMVSGSEYGVYQVVQTAFAAPSPSEASGWFIGCWGLVMVFYLASRITGAVVAMFK